ncbi:MAG: ATP-binding cassette domain-containing protein [Pseudomonadota bacterium]|nr:ATP-binding cassette domain-containing protein [Pseudomonadota bacterium]
MNDTPIKISIRGLSKSFGPKRVLTDLDLDVREGESMAVIGASGTGKSVLLKNIVGILTPDSGSIKIDGEEIVGVKGNARDRINRKLGMLFQGAALFDSLPLWENAAFGQISGDSMCRNEARVKAIERLKQVGLSESDAYRYPSDISAGAQKRVGLARAIATQPEILFFDEPTTGIDPIMGDVIDGLIASCVRDLGATALTITHDMESARRISDRIAMIYEGKIVWVGKVSEIDNSGNEFVDQFIHGRAEGPMAKLIAANASA